MTTFTEEVQSCFVCSTDVKCMVLTSTNTFGSPDLDLRPPEMQRSAMHAWLHECTNCHYVNGILSEPVGDAKNVVASASYQTIVGDSGLPDPARKYHLYALLNQDDPEELWSAYLRAAWACDDAAAADRSTSYRDLAANELSALLTSSDGEQRETLACILVDVLRRARRLDESSALARSTMSELAAGNGPIRAVLVYQLKLCDAGDLKAHTVSEAIEADGGS